VAQAVDHLLCKHEDLSSNHSKKNQWINKFKNINDNMENSGTDLKHLRINHIKALKIN
jgi:hypothetical protein